MFLKKIFIKGVKCFFRKSLHFGFYFCIIILQKDISKYRFRLLKEIKKQSLLDSIVRAIEEYIIVNELKAGDRLPTEKFLKENLKVGRNSVREALKALEVIGLVTEAYSSSLPIRF